jgi:hypothetical protein
VISVTIDAKQALKDLRRFREKAIPYAIRNALNRSAFHARAEWKTEVRNEFTLRNRYTEQSILVDRATGKSVSGMVAVVGSKAAYMDEQEHGATVRGGGKHKAIPGPVAAGLPPGGKRTKLVRGANKLSALRVSRPVGKNPRQRNAVALAMARRRGERVALLERPRGGKGLFRLTGGKKKPQTRLLWDLSRSSVTVKPTPTLQRTLTRIQPRLVEIHRDAIVEQLRRHKVLGY